ncbi:MAG: metallophosphoesterase, partial [Oscillospiraceae bacterium]|nr:metallophosphoesterase [Oscillospiraceae bacterium]
MTRVYKIRIFLLLLPAAVCVLFLLSACGGQAAADAEHAAVPGFPPLREKDGLRIAVASDLHFNPDDRPDPETPRETAYSLELADALLWDVRQQGADLLILTGDLCNGGKPHRHEALTEKLRKLEADGIAVYVLPGNHDLSPVTQTEFAALYTDFGYGEASSRDKTSLSYAVIRDGLMLLMLDTAGYPAVSADLPGASLPDSNQPFLSDEPLRWAEEQLAEAKKKNLTVLAAGHYHVLTP